MSHLFCLNELNVPATMPTAQQSYQVNFCVLLFAIVARIFFCAFFYLHVVKTVFTAATTFKRVLALSRRQNNKMQNESHTHTHS